MAPPGTPSAMQLIGSPRNCPADTFQNKEEQDKDLNSTKYQPTSWTQARPQMWLYSVILEKGCQSLLDHFSQDKPSVALLCYPSWDTKLVTL